MKTIIKLACICVLCVIAIYAISSYMSNIYNITYADFCCPKCGSDAVIVLTENTDMVKYRCVDCHTDMEIEKNY